VTPLFLRFNASKVTLSGFAGGEYFPLPASKGPAFPFPLTLEGYPTSPPDSLRNNGVPLEKSGNSSSLSVDKEERRYIHPFYHIMRGHTFSEAPRPQVGACGPRAGQLFAKPLKGERELLKGDMILREWKRFR